MSQLKEAIEKLLGYDTYLADSALLMPLEAEQNPKIVIMCPGQKAMDDVNEILQALLQAEEPEAGEFTKDLRKMLAGGQTTLKLKRIYTAAKEACDIIDQQSALEEQHTDQIESMAIELDRQAAELRFIKDEIYEAYINNEASPKLYGKLSGEQAKDKP